MFVIFFVAVLIVACTLTPTSEPAPSQSDMETYVAMMVTEAQATSRLTQEIEESEIRTPTLDMNLTEHPDEGQTDALTVTASPSSTSFETIIVTETSTQAFTSTITTTATSTITLIPTDIPLVSPTTSQAILYPDVDMPWLGTSPDWTDDMDDGHNWNTDKDDFTEVVFKQGSMQLIGLSPVIGWRLAGTIPLENAYIEIKFINHNCSSADYYGIIFNVPVLKEADRGFLFGASCGSSFVLLKWDGKAQPAGHMTTLIPWRTDSVINGGNYATNRLGVLTDRGRIVLFVNDLAVAEIRDTTYESGHFGVLISARETGYFTVDVDEVSYWDYQ
jgi:hypothetical protein